MSSPDGDITLLLNRWVHGDPEAFDALIPMVYTHLRNVATGLLRFERSDHTLQATGLVNELFLALLAENKARFEDRTHFYMFSARAMRNILVDHARSRQRMKRQAGHTRVELSPELTWIDPEGPEMLDLDRSLSELAEAEPRKAQVVELRIFLGCTSEEAAGLLQISKPTVDRDLRFALAWLYDCLSNEQRADGHQQA